MHQRAASNHLSPGLSLWVGKGNDEPRCNPLCVSAREQQPRRDTYGVNGTYFFLDDNPLLLPKAASVVESLKCKSTGGLSFTLAFEGILPHYIGKNMHELIIKCKVVSNSFMLPLPIFKSWLLRAVCRTLGHISIMFMFAIISTYSHLSL